MNRAGTARPCILLFARSARSEAMRKGLRGAEVIFELATRRVIAAAEALGVDLVIAGSVARSQAPNALVIPQRGRSFAERLASAFSDARELGYERIVAVGHDTPSLRTEHLERAFTALEEHSLVLGPSEDGGVYLIGARGPIEDRFVNVRWKVRSTLADLLALESVCLLERLADVDGRRDLDRLEPGRDRELAGVLASIRRRSPIGIGSELAKSERCCGNTSIRGPPR